MRLRLLAISAVALSMSLTAQADPTVIGMTLGKTTESEMLSLYDADSKGVNVYSQGNMYSIPTRDIEFEGLQELTAIFDANQKLAAVLMVLPKDKFKYVNGMLSKKYKLVNQNIPFVGNTSANYRDGQSKIQLDAPHLSFQMTLNYLRNDFLKQAQDQQRAEKQKKQQSESSLL